MGGGQLVSIILKAVLMGDYFLGRQQVGRAGRPEGSPYRPWGYHCRKPFTGNSAPAFGTASSIALPTSSACAGCGGCHKAIYVCYRKFEFHTDRLQCHSKVTHQGPYLQAFIQDMLSDIHRIPQQKYAPLCQLKRVTALGQMLGWLARAWPGPLAMLVCTMHTSVKQLPTVYHPTMN